MGIFIKTNNFGVVFIYTYIKDGHDFLEDFAPVEFTREEQEACHEWAAIGRCTHSTHSVINYEKVLKLGFRGILAEVTEYENKMGQILYIKP